MISPKPTLALLCLAFPMVIVGCNRDAETATERPTEPVASMDAGAEVTNIVNEPVIAAASTLASSSPTGTLPVDTLGDDAALDALVDESEIPYPVYPNGEKYRVGGENGLKIVLFETTDSFEEVDAFYGSQATGNGMPRLAATTMDDYVRYAKTSTDTDPWGTDRPGIVIHRFTDDEARTAVGANATARTNIIMSF